MTEPRDFHIGTKIRFTAGQWSWDGFVRGVVEDRIFFEFEDMEDDPCDYQRKSFLCHASDGAPLGKWVPLPLSAFLQLQDYTAEDAQEQANDFIRGGAR